MVLDFLALRASFLRKNHARMSKMKPKTNFYWKKSRNFFDKIFRVFFSILLSRFWRCYVKIVKVIFKTGFDTVANKNFPVFRIILRLLIIVLEGNLKGMSQMKKIIARLITRFKNTFCSRFLRKPKVPFLLKGSHIV